MAIDWRSKEGDLGGREETWTGETQAPARPAATALARRGANSAVRTEPLLRPPTLFLVCSVDGSRSNPGSMPPLFPAAWGRACPQGNRPPGQASNLTAPSKTKKGTASENDTRLPIQPHYLRVFRLICLPLSDARRSFCISSTYGKHERKYIGRRHYKPC